MAHLCSAYHRFFIYDKKFSILPLSLWMGNIILSKLIQIHSFLNRNHKVIIDGPTTDAKCSNSSRYKLNYRIMAKVCHGYTKGWVFLHHTQILRHHTCIRYIPSVAMVMTDVFHKNRIMLSGKLAKIVRIFVDIGHIKSQRVMYWPERIRPVIPTLWSGHDFSQIHDQNCDHSILWELLVRFFWANIWPLGFWCVLCPQIFSRF